MWRRWSWALALSVLAHVALVVAVLGLGLGRGLGGRVDVEITGMRLDEIKDLPLGGPAGADDRQGQARHRAHHRAPPAPAAGTLATPADDHEQAGAAAPVDDESGPAPTGDLNAYGPKGSRFTVLLRLDRLRGTDYAAPVDALLMRLPDRRDLLEGTDLDLFASFDAVLIATPHPLDPSVTFLAARHHLDEAALRAALGRGARATDRILSWHTEAGRPIGERRARHAAGPGAPVTRDERIIVLAAPGLAVVTPPAYRAMLLARPAAPKIGDGDAGTDPDAGTPDGGAPAALGWAPLLSRIDAEEGLMPPDGVVMVSAIDIFKPAGAPDAGPHLIHGLEIPPAVSGAVGISDAPALDLEGEFPTEGPALRWEAEWPAILSQLRSHPYVLLSGFSPLLSRATLTRDGRKLHLHVTATRDETLRLLAFALHMLGG
jgi:hypothetical protein